MLRPGSDASVWLYTDPVDMRKSIDGLALLVEQEMVLPLSNGTLLVFLTEEQFASLYKEFLSFLNLLYRRIPADRQLNIILDNLSMNKTQAAQEWVAATPRINLHFTPTSSSWLNAVES